MLNKTFPFLIIIIFTVSLIPIGFQDVFAETMVIGPGASVTVESGSTISIDSDDSPNSLTNKGTLTVEDGGNVIITKEGNFFNDCDANTFLNLGSTMQIGGLGALLATLTNHGSVLGPGQINFIANTIEVKNSNILTAVLNPVVPILNIVSICIDEESAQIQALIDDVNALVPDQLDSRTARSLTWLLNAALSAEENGDSQTAKSKLASFEARVTLFMNRGIVDQSVGEALIDTSQSITFPGVGE